MYDKIVTKGIIVGARNLKTKDRLLYIVTEELGMITAVGKSLRSNTSKLRFYAQIFSHATFEFIRGRQMWTLVGVGEQKQVSQAMYQHRAIIARMMLDMVYGEADARELYAVVAKAWEQLSVVHPEDADKILSYTLARLYKILGYWPKDGGEIPDDEDRDRSSYGRIRKTVLHLQESVDTGSFRNNDNG